LLERHSTEKRKHTDVFGTDGDLLAVGLVDDAINLLQVVRVGDDLVTGDKVLRDIIVSKSCGIARGFQDESALWCLMEGAGYDATGCAQV
jgi:hypothetical protein